MGLTRRFASIGWEKSTKKSEKRVNIDALLSIERVRAFPTSF
jgi:hypothetical protein